MTKENYLSAVKGLLAQVPNTWSTFLMQWDAGNFRAAYLVVQEYLQQTNIVPTPEFKKADYDFYWEYVS